MKTPQCFSLLALAAILATPDFVTGARKRKKRSKTSKSSKDPLTCDNPLTDSLVKLMNPNLDISREFKMPNPNHHPEPLSNFFELSWFFPVDESEEKMTSLFREEEEKVYFQYDSCMVEPEGYADFGTCATEYLCSYMSKSMCDLFLGTFYTQDSCASHGFARLIEFTATQYLPSPPMKVCIRQSNNMPDPTYCQNAQTSSTGLYGEYCIGDEEDGESPFNCASAGLAENIKIPDSHMNDVDICIAAVSLLKAAPVCPSSSVAPTGEICDISCQVSNAGRSVALMAIGKIPKIGGALSSIVGLIWKDFNKSIADIVGEIVEYIDARIAEAKSDLVLGGVRAGLVSLGERLKSLHDYINAATLESPLIDLRRGLIDGMINFDCVDLHAELTRPEVNPVNRVPFITLIGAICIDLHYERFHTYEEVVGEAMPDNAIDLYRDRLDKYIETFVTLANNDHQALSKWRNDFLIAPRAWRGGWPCGWTCNSRYAEMFDNACPQFANVRDKKIGYGHQCCNNIDLSLIATPAMEMYGDLAMQSFSDGLLGSLTSIRELWPYMNSTLTSQDIKPNQVHKLAVSPHLGRFDQIRIENQGSISPPRFTSNYADYAELRDTIDSSARVKKIEITRGDRIIGIKFTYTLKGVHKTTTVGRWGDQVKATYDFDSNEVITAISSSDTRVGSLLVFAIKTSLVDNSGKMIVEEYKTWAPFGNDPLGGRWISAPDVGVAQNDTFVPHVVALAGHSTNNQNIVNNPWPLWVYQKFE